MPLTKLQFKPGINRENTSYSNEGGWYDCNKIRFRFGVPEKIGGWQKDTTNTFLGTCRALKAWVTLAGTQLLGVGTHLKYYINKGGDYNDITPVRATTASGDINFVATVNSQTITVTDASHGAETNDFVTFSSATSTGLGGCITASALNQSFQITKVDANSYTITLGEASANATLETNITSSVTTIAMVEAASTLPTAAQSAGTMLIGTEKITYTGTSGKTLTGCTRGALSTTAAAHTQGAKLILLPNTTDAGTTAINVGGGINDSATDITVDSSANFPSAGMIKIDSELITYASKPSGTVIRVSGGGTRGFGSTTAAAHDDDAVVTNTASAIGAYDIAVGLDNTVFGTGWGTDTWGRSTWGSDGTRTLSSIMRLWSHDNFGQNLLINVRDGDIYYWDTSSDSLGTSRATALASVSGADSTTPTVAKQVMVDPNVHVIVFGCDAETSIGTQDPLLIRFADQGTVTTWQSLATNSAGDLRVTSGSEIVQAVKTRQQILVFTDVSLHTMQYLGPPFTFGLNLVSENITLMSSNAAKSVDDFVFWMGLEDFYAYDGRVQKVPCSVRSYVFNDFNLEQKEKVFASLNSTFNEVWWFYPSADSTEIDRYVIYNYSEKVWSFGTLVRTAWLDRGIFDYPLATDTSGILYDHEFGLNDVTSAIDAHIESSQIDIGDGENFLFLDRLIPDITFTGSTENSPVATFTLKTRNFPGGNYLQSNDSSVTQSVAETSTVVEQFTDQAFVRLRGRSFALKVASSQEGVQWRLGTPRVNIRPDGRR